MKDTEPSPQLRESISVEYFGSIINNHTVEFAAQNTCLCWHKYTWISWHTQPGMFSYVSRDFSHACIDGYHWQDFMIWSSTWIIVTYKT